MHYSTKKKIAKHPADWWLFFCVCVLSGIGIIMVFSSSIYFAQFAPYNDSFYFVKRQLINLLLGFGAMYVLFRLPLGLIRNVSPVALGLVCAALGMVLLSSFGEEGGGAMRWLTIGGISLQPSEFCKPILIVFISKLLYERTAEDGSIRSGRAYAYCLAVMLLCCGLIIIEDLSSAVVLAVSVFLLMCCSQIRWPYHFITVIIGILGVAAMIVFEPYRMQRLLEFTDPGTNGGWQVMQSKMAIGSGGLMGVGLGAGNAKLYWLPARHTDFIFGVIGEELGLLGCIFVLFLFAVLFWRGFNIAVNSTNRFNAYCALGLTLLLAIQTVINLLVVVGFAPVTGITLPFVSYGGSSLIVSLAIVGLLLNISQYTEKNK
ncbi:MAG: putative lipid II flippase FtsW [Firmicutes bacterium]|nr:putative lipid II flippase FtsW [Bacillota bacterium]